MFSRGITSCPRSAAPKIGRTNHKALTSNFLQGLIVHRDAGGPCSSLPGIANFRVPRSQMESLDERCLTPTKRMGEVRAGAPSGNGFAKLNHSVGTAICFVGIMVMVHRETFIKQSRFLFYFIIITVSDTVQFFKDENIPELRVGNKYSLNIIIVYKFKYFMDWSSHLGYKFIYYTSYFA